MVKVSTRVLGSMRAPPTRRFTDAGQAGQFGFQPVDGFKAAAFAFQVDSLRVQGQVRDAQAVMRGGQAVDADQEVEDPSSSGAHSGRGARLFDFLPHLGQGGRRSG